MYLRVVGISPLSTNFCIGFWNYFDTD